MRTSKPLAAISHTLSFNHCHWLRQRTSCALSLFKCFPTLITTTHIHRTHTLQHRDSMPLFYDTHFSHFSKCFMSGFVAYFVHLALRGEDRPMSTPCVNMWTWLGAFRCGEYFLHLYTFHLQLYSILGDAIIIIKQYWQITEVIHPTEILLTKNETKCYLFT